METRIISQSEVTSPFSKKRKVGSNQKEDELMFRDRKRLKSDTPLDKKQFLTICKPIVETVLHIDLTFKEEIKQDGEELKFRKMKVAGLDLDSTLISTKSGEQFSKNEHDWKFVYASVPQKLKELHEQGFKIVIFTQQMGISKGKITKESFIKKVMHMQEELNVPLELYVSTHLDYYRKPSVLFWRTFEDKMREQHSEINFEESFYCGDCAGRKMNPTSKKPDLKDSDLKFALNSGLRFLCPEELFLKTKSSKNQSNLLPNFDKYQETIQTFREASDYTKVLDDIKIFLSHSFDQKRLIIICGPPSIGKTKLSNVMRDNLLENEVKEKFLFFQSQAKSLRNLIIDLENLMSGDSLNLVLELSQQQFPQMAMSTTRKQLSKLAHSKNFEIFAIEVCPFAEDRQAQLIFCQHLDIVKKLSNSLIQEDEDQESAYKESLAKVFQAYQPIQEDEEYDVLMKVDRPYRIRNNNDQDEQLIFKML